MIGHLHHHVCKLVVLHWSKLPAIHAEKVSECIDLSAKKTSARSVKESEC